MSIKKIPVDPYLKTMREGHGGNKPNPWRDVPDTDAVAAAMWTMTGAIADFVDACRSHPQIGYRGAVTNLVDIVGAFEAVPKSVTVPQFAKLTDEEREMLAAGRGDEPPAPAVES